MNNSLSCGLRPHLSRRWLSRTALALFLTLCLLGTARPAGAQPAEAEAPASFQAPVRADTIREVIARWRPAVHLYVLGDVGLDDETLAELAGWLADKHWTVLLVENAVGQTYTDGDGVPRWDDLAIEYGTGHGIARRPDFIALAHPRTGEPDGAILSIVLAQRSLFYTGSQAQDSRSLGEDRFQGYLDQWAIEALRSGRGIVHAVRDTVSNIDARLAEAIDQERAEADGLLASAKEQTTLLESRTRQLREVAPGALAKLEIADSAGLRTRASTAGDALGQGHLGDSLRILRSVVHEASSSHRLLDELEREVDHARSYIRIAGERLATLEERAAGLRQRDSRLSGPLARPDVRTLRQELALAETALAEDPEQASAAAQAVQRQADEQIGMIEEYPATGQALDAARRLLADLERRERAEAARGSLAAAREHLDAARELHAQATPGYAERLEAARHEMAAAERRISDASLEAALWRAQQVFLLIAAGAALAAAGLSLNRRRRSVKNEAETLLADWRAALDRKLAVFFDELERRIAQFVGPASGEGQRPHAGTTLRLTEQIRADVGSLSILWTSANSVLERAEVLIRARGLGAIYNFFFPSKYRRGIALLKDEPVPFDPADGLPRLFGEERTWRDDLLGDLASYEPFRKSFQEIVAELNLRAARAVESLDVIEKSVVQGPSELEGIEERIRQAGSLQEKIGRAGAGDGLFLVPALFVAARPAATAALARARELFPTDPVGALQGDGALARRIAVEALQLAALVAAARHGVLTAVEAGMATLREASIATGWIEAERIRLSGEADLLAGRAAEEPVASDIEELAQGMAETGRRVDRAVALCVVLGSTARPEIHRVSEIVRVARGELSATLGLAADRLLREEDADPSERLEGATRQAETAHERLGQGELDAAAAALAEAARLTAEAADIVEASRQALATHAATVAEWGAETGRIEGLLPDHERILAGIRATFAPSVLFLRAGDPDHPDANGILTDNLEEARAHLELAHEKLDRAVTAHRSGRLLASADLLRQVKLHQELAVHRLEEVAERQARLERTVESNRSLLETLESRVVEDQTTVAGDPRIMQPTLAAFAEGRRQVETLRRIGEAAPGDPFVTEEALLAAKVILDEVHDRRAPSDRLLFTETQRSVEAARQQLTAAQDLARRAAGDGIADSPEIVRALHEIEALGILHGRISEALQAPHGDWNVLDQEADRIASEAARQAASLSGQIAAAQQATAALSNASQKVREASYWSGGHGTTSPGANDLFQGRALLAVGRYEDASRQAQEAYRAAADAIEIAREQMRRLREEEERRDEERRRAAEERRRRSAESSSLLSSSSSSSSRSWSSGGGSSSSGSGRSSWGGSSSGSGGSSGGSSGSGSGRSGW